jgi:hypothetical protein
MSGKFHRPHAVCLCVTERVNQGYESLASLRHAYLGSFFLEPEDIKCISLRAIWNFSKATGLPLIDIGQKGPVI